MCRYSSALPGFGSQVVFASPMQLINCRVSPFVLNMAGPADDERCFRNPYLADQTCAVTFGGDAGKAKVNKMLR